jgi:hypothetical protein
VRFSLFSLSSLSRDYRQFLVYKYTLPLIYTIKVLICITVIIIINSKKSQKDFFYYFEWSKSSRRSKESYDTQEAKKEECF